MNSPVQRKTGIILTVILLAVISAGFIPDPSARNGSSLTLVVARAESAPAEFDVDSLAEILYLFDGDSKYTRLKNRFIENFEKLPPESRNKVIQMYLGGKKEQPDKLLLMKGMSATARYFRGLEEYKKSISEYLATGTIKYNVNADVGDVTGGVAILEYFPQTVKSLIPFLQSADDINQIIEHMSTIYKDIAEKNRAEAAKNRAEIAELEKRIAFMQEITDMINKALGK